MKKQTIYKREKVFSDKRLKSCISVSFFESLQKLKDGQSSCENYLKKIMIKYNKFVKKELNEFRIKIKEKFPVKNSILLLNSSKKAVKQTYIEEHNKGSCLFCK